MLTRDSGKHFETLKGEMVADCVYASHDEARQAIFEYVEVYYSR